MDEQKVNKSSGKKRPKHSLRPMKRAIQVVDDNERAKVRASVAPGRKSVSFSP